MLRQLRLRQLRAKRNLSPLFELANPIYALGRHHVWEIRFLDGTAPPFCPALNESAVRRQVEMRRGSFHVARAPRARELCLRLTRLRAPQLLEM